MAPNYLTGSKDLWLFSRICGCEDEFPTAYLHASWRRLEGYGWPTPPYLAWDKLWKTLPRDSEPGFLTAQQNLRGAQARISLWHKALSSVPAHPHLQILLKYRTYDTITTFGVRPQQERSSRGFMDHDKSG